VTPPPDSSEDRPDVQDFATWLLQQSNGRSHDELSAGLHDLVAKVVETGKKGSVTYTVTVAPLDKDVQSLVVTDEIKLKLPEHDRKASIFYPDGDGNLSRRDPNQLSFDDIHDIPAHNPATGEIRRTD
jgi:hypothetical protein